ncbi:MAG: right-handed parallel beta-helix repeat-containing protein [Candidatus Neomarinimicrobiota bacterium]|jgi:parallel beta-helix repeat protein
MRIHKIFPVFITILVLFFTEVIYPQYTIYTPEGKPVNAKIFCRTPEHTIEWAQYWINFFPLDAEIISEPTRAYNCHGYAWVITEGIGNYWIEDDEELIFFTDGLYSNDSLPSYSVLSGSDTVNATHGWYEPYTHVDHSIRVIQNGYPVATSGSRTHVSKWCDGTLVRHAPYNDYYTAMWQMSEVPFGAPPVSIQYFTLKTTHSGTLSDHPKTWIGAGGITHTISSMVTVPSGGSLKIKSGATVEFAQGANLVINGTLTVESDVNFNIPSGSQLVINGTLSTGSNITILPGATLTVNSGSQLNFSNGKSLIIDGTLSATGTSVSKITFDFTSPSSTYQNGIKFNSGSGGTLSYCNIKNAYHGVKCHSSLPTIQYCDIYNNGTGIYIYNAGPRSSPIHNNNIYSNSANGIFIYNSTIANVYENTVTDNSECGIYCTTNGTPYLWENIITDNNQAGVYCIINSRALFGDRHCNPGYNLITQNYTGVTCGLESYVRIGTASLAGHNSIHDNTGYEVTSTYDSYVKAEYNWWNRYPPSYPNYYYAGDFYTYMGGTIDYDPSLTYDPIAERMAKTVAYKGGVESNPQAVSASFLDSELNEALDYLFEGKYEEAIAIYVRRLNNETDKSRQKYLLSCIAECYELSGKDGFIDYLNNDVRKNLSVKDELYAKTLELENYVLMRAGNIQKAIDNYLIMKNEFTDNDIIQKNALFNLGYLHYMALDNRTQGKTYFDEFIKKYPDDDLNLIVYETTGEPEKWKLIKKSAPPIADEADIAVLPSEYRLLNNYPNPFNPTTTIAYDLPEESYVILTIYDIVGREIIRLVDNIQPAGSLKVTWHGKNGFGQIVPSGIYLYSLKISSGYNATKKMVFMR